jgi:hypothetical protein
MARGSGSEWLEECKRIASDKEDLAEMSVVMRRQAAGVVGRVLPYVVGEPLCVLVDAVNPLDIDLPLSNMRLFAEWKLEGDKAADPAAVVVDASALLSGVWASPLPSASELQAGYAVYAASTTLLPRQRKQVRAFEG